MPKLSQAGSIGSPFVSTGVISWENVKADSRAESALKSSDLLSVEGSDEYKTLEEHMKDIIKDPLKHLKLKYPTYKYNPERRKKEINRIALERSIHPSEVILLEADSDDPRVQELLGDRPDELEPEVRD